MKLRTRLFLSVGALFILFFVVAYVLENYLVQDRLEGSAQKMREQIEKINENRRKRFEEFIGIGIAGIQGEIDALLYRVDEFSYLKSGFYPSDKNVSGKTWYAASELLLHYKWINYIQNTIDGKISSLIVPSAQDLHPITYYKVDDRTYWVSVQTGNSEKVYLGLVFSLREIVGGSAPYLDIDIGKYTDMFFLFDPETIINFDNPPSFKEEGFDFEEQHLEEDNRKEVLSLRDETLLAINKAKKYLKTTPVAGMPSEQLTGWVKSNFKEATTVDGHSRTFPASIVEKGKRSDSKLIEQQFLNVFHRRRDRDDAVVLIWAYASFFYSDLFGTDPLSPKAPIGIASILPGKKAGSALLTRGTFYDKPFFNDKKFALQNAESLKTSDIPTGIAIIDYPENDEVFLGNLLKIPNTESKGYLTIGKSIDDLLERISLASDRYSALVHNDQVITAYSPIGNKIKSSIFYDIPIKKMTESKGVIELDNTKYYFLHMQPYKDVDLHFYIFEPESEVFSYVYLVHDSISKMINKLSWSMRYIAIGALFFALIFLELIARRITRPISTLAKATPHISKGHFEDVQLPEIPPGRKDEIATLCSSFTEMIQGLKDREKVKGVLNKVVSKEIAEEILKGNVTLGGEEKEATILFADIRGFTHLTEKMPPKDVIDLLNTCMTKISHIVDEYGGVIDKYVGDEAMALFGAPVVYKNNAARAVCSAIEMIEKIYYWDEERRAQGLPNVEIGIGICTGKVVAGNMGAEDRLNYTVLGANVNLAARLCSAAKPGEILITKDTYESPGVKEAVSGEELPPLELKGFSEKVIVYRVERFLKGKPEFTESDKA